MAGLTVDTGALIAAERNDRAVWSYFRRSHRETTLTVPTVVLAQAWRGPRNAALAIALRGCEIEPLTEPMARAAGELLGISRTSDAIDAIVVLSAASRGDAILTSDPDDLRQLAGFLRTAVHIIAI